MTAAAARTPALALLVAGAAIGYGIRARWWLRWGDGSLERLIAPSPSARQTSLAGQTLEGNGNWQGGLITHRIAGQDGVWQITVPADSAALLTVD